VGSDHRPPSPWRSVGADAQDDDEAVDPLDLRTALERTLELVASSRSSPWSADDVEQISRHLRAAIAALQSGAPVDRASLGLLFAPTGAIQETSLDNGWGEEFLSLSRSVDAFLANEEGDPD
jgi:hypothetical protein